MSLPPDPQWLTWSSIAGTQNQERPFIDHDLSGAGRPRDGRSVGACRKGHGRSDDPDAGIRNAGTAPIRAVWVGIPFGRGR
jgi:hypothetical protein